MNLPVLVSSVASEPKVPQLAKQDAHPAVPGSSLTPPRRLEFAALAPPAKSRMVRPLPVTHVNQVHTRATTLASTVTQARRAQQERLLALSAPPLSTVTPQLTLSVPRALLDQLSTLHKLAALLAVPATTRPANLVFAALTVTLLTMAPQAAPCALLGPIPVPRLMVSAPAARPSTLSIRSSQGALAALRVNSKPPQPVARLALMERLPTESAHAVPAHLESIPTPTQAHSASNARLERTLPMLPVCDAPMEPHLLMDQLTTPGNVPLALRGPFLASPPPDSARRAALVPYPTAIARLAFLAPLERTSQAPLFVLFAAMA